MLANVGIRIRPRAINEETQCRIIRVIESRDLHHGSRFTVAIAADFNLCASEVELCVTALGTVQGDVLDADEILTGGGVAGEGELDGGKVPRAPVLIVLAAGHCC